MSYCTSLNGNLPEQFFVALGEVRTLKSLDLSFSGTMNVTLASNLGKAIAFNARKDNSLEYLNLDGGVIQSYYNFNQMFDNMNVCEADHERWYGDSAKVNKMSGKDFEKKYYNNLKNLQLNSTNMASGFDYINWKKGFQPEDPKFVQFLARSKNLTTVQLKSCQLHARDADILFLSLDPTRAHFASNIQVLNLAKNNLQKEGAKTLATVFEKNNILQVLDISHNKLGVAGAIYLANAL
mmetsp:Transcript_30468/g.27705  ORF Transcript_30468/g.27705 Transcript_30468/m.27705 type:complete len:238 (-) Transcript_30468:967-1680(-)